MDMHHLIAGVDEAGRGALAGPVAAAAAVLPPGLKIEGLDDSKKLSRKRREALYDIITREAICWGIGYASVAEIESINILQAAMLAMRRAVSTLSPQPVLVLVDGNYARGFPQKAIPIVGGDARIPAISAASILAKVTRDRLMAELAETYPQYAFAQHKGYGTALHYERLRAFGPCIEHRKSFLKKQHNE